ncbi:LysR family transcriptional regulator [Vibrio sp. T11.5]|uniref:LysR family transcriptional regulator n=1 Tax=Vibrio sp. T11.5 TaxID=2998836 RepID=UPI0022CD6E59|nr:LysR family transcriptional regulator [Vibrio sp. T11.5]MDA0117552.1 LysR family transcriptional regulator [Vibrio sp. T11.5]
MKEHSLDDLQLFVLSSKYRSLTQASEQLDVPLATLSRRLTKLENQLNCRLLDRGTHKFSLTPDGKKYQQLCEPLIVGLDRVTERLSMDRQSLSGNMKISAPINMTQVWLKHCIYEFAEKHPDIRIELEIQNEKIDLVSHQVDVTFRIGDLIEMDWIARKLWQLPFSLCASRSYLDKSEPILHPSDLAKHRLLTVHTDRHWKMHNQNTGETFSYNDTFDFSSNDVLLIRDAAIRGLGIAWIPPYYFAEEQYLEEVLPEWKSADREVYIMYRDRDKRPARVDAFIKHVFEWRTRFNVVHPALETSSNNSHL